MSELPAECPEIHHLAPPIPSPQAQQIARSHGWAWCYEHRAWERLDDRIDFPVSSDWLALYHEQGLTYRRPISLLAESTAARELTAAITELRELLTSAWPTAPPSQPSARPEPSHPPAKQAPKAKPWKGVEM